MALYWVGYDLDKPGHNYDGLIKRLRELGATRIMLSDWLLPNDAKAEAIRNDMQRYMDKNDRIMVAELHNSAAWNNLLVGNEVVKDLFNKYAR